MSMKRILTNYELSTRIMGRLSHVVSGNLRYVDAKPMAYFEVDE
jgi:hypothetical protein